MTGVVVRIGTRGSALARVQAEIVATELADRGARPMIVIVETEGDVRPPDTAWGEGVFVAAIERELIAGRIDVAVHSAKDLPTYTDARLRIAAYLPRADPRDALVIRRGAGTCLSDLPVGARVGTDSPRRTGFLLALRPDLIVRPVHGNVDTRLRRLDAGDSEALVLAAAGLDRLGLGDRIAERLDPANVPPAPGQGAIAIQVRADDPISDVVAAIDDQDTRLAVEAERAFLAACGGGCRSPIGALATLDDAALRMVAGRVAVDGTDPRFGRRVGARTRTAEFVAQLAAQLSDVTFTGRPAGPTGSGNYPRVIVTRAAHQSDGLVRALRDVALDAVEVPSIAISLGRPGGPLDTALRSVDRYSWVVVTSSNGGQAVIAAARRVRAPIEATRWAVIGTATRALFQREGVDVHFQPTSATAATLGRELEAHRGDRVLVIRGNLGDGELRAILEERGAIVDEVVAYTTEEAPATSAGLLRAAYESGPVAAVIFTSGSTVRGFRSLSVRDGIEVAGLPAICVGETTAAAAAAAGFEVIGVAAVPDASSLAETTALAIRRLVPSGPSASSTGALVR